MDRYHLKKDGDLWKLAKREAERATLTSDTKEDALQKSMEFMNNHGGSMLIHKEDGQFQEERTYPRSAAPRKSPGYSFLPGLSEVRAPPEPVLDIWHWRSLDDILHFMTLFPILCVIA